MDSARKIDRLAFLVRLILREQKQVIDGRSAPTQTAAMKYLPHLLLATATALSLASCAAPGGGGSSASSEAKLGPHSAQKFVMVSRLGSHNIDPNFITSMALVIRVEQQMNGNQQKITATASAHKDGPQGVVSQIGGLRVHVLQPKDFGTQPKASGQSTVTDTVPAPGGKYKTVVAEASIHSADFPDTTVSLT